MRIYPAITPLRSRASKAMVCVVFSVICSLLWILRMFIAAHLVFSVTFTLFVCVALHTTLYDKTLQHTLFQGTDFTKPL